MSYTPPPPPPGYWRPAPVPLAPNGQPLASFLDRFLAFLVDSLILSAVGAVFVFPLMIIWMVLVIQEMNAGAQTMSGPNPWVFIGTYFLLVGAIILLSLIFSYLYYVEYVWRQNGQTVGKKVMKLWVVPVTPGEALTRAHLAKRWLVQSVAGQAVPGLSLLDGLWQLWDKPLQQCLHDKAAQTVVVKLG